MNNKEKKVLSRFCLRTGRSSVSYIERGADLLNVKFLLGNKSLKKFAVCFVQIIYAIFFVYCK